MLPQGLHVEALVGAVLTGQRPNDADAARLAAVGLTRFDVWSRLAATWAELIGPAAVAEEILPALLSHAAAAADPDGAVLGLARLQELIGGVTLPRRMTADPRFGHDLMALLGLGALPSVALMSDPGLMDLLDPDLLERDLNREDLTTEALELVLRLKSPEARANALRRWKRSQFVRIIARDLLLQQPQRIVTREIAFVADAATSAALAVAFESALGAYPPDGVRGLAVIAMGKWGSEELNYNSDIDLLCVYESFAGGPDAGQWEQIVGRMAKLLSEQTVEGRVFRVDFRLRPEGSAGSLVRSLESFAAYYQSQGEPWEAQALTRARSAAGDEALGRRFEELAERVAYGARVGPAAVAHIRANRRRLDDRAALLRDVKEGRGGIRDIEFTTQLLQLVRGVTDPQVRRRNTWAALAALARTGAISEAERRGLAESYDFLRRVEHLLQIQPPAPTRRIPDHPDELRRLARALGYQDARGRSAAQRFLDDYESHTATARDLCNRLFFNPIPLSSPDAAEAIQELLDPLVSDEDAARHLTAIPFEDPLTARRRLLFLAHGEPPMRLPPEIQAQFVELLPALLACVQRMPNPDAALYWFERFIACAGGRDLFYRFLVENPPIIELLCRIGGHSDVLAQTIVKYPEYLNCVIHPSFINAELPPDLLAEHLRERLKPLRRPEDRFEDMRRFRRREAFRIGVRDVLNLSPVEAIGAELSDLAEVVLSVLCDELASRLDGADSIRFAVVAGGKFGGRELHYSSDLDVLFVFDGPPEGVEIAERFARQLIGEAGRVTRSGRLYELDARLRPFGANSPLAPSLGAYERYFAEHAEPWERLAMCRVRPVAGDADLGQAFRQLAHGFAFGPPPSPSDIEMIRHAKRRIETERRDTTDREHLDPKLEPGGILDVEFLVQTLQIQHGHHHPEPEFRSPNTPTALAALGAAGLLTRREVDVLLRNYLYLRRLEMRLQIVLERSSGLLPLDPDGLSEAAKRLGWSFAEAEGRPEQLLRDVRGSLRAIREIYEQRIGVET